MLPSFVEFPELIPTTFPKGIDMLCQIVQLSAVASETKGNHSSVCHSTDFNKCKTSLSKSLIDNIPNQKLI